MAFNVHRLKSVPLCPFNGWKQARRARVFPAESVRESAITQAANRCPDHDKHLPGKQNVAFVWLASLPHRAAAALPPNHQTHPETGSKETSRPSSKSQIA